MNSNKTYRKSIKLVDNKFFSCFIYFMNPGGIEKKHFHDGIELEYVIRGNCKTHKQRRLYIRRRGDIHEGINDSKEELIFICVQIPSETENNTHYF